MAKALEGITVLDFSQAFTVPVGTLILADLGEHNFEIYSRMLGYSEPEIRQLAEDRVI